MVDEADRLEVLRDLHEESQVGMILLGLPGLERYGQVYGRVGFVDQMRALGVEEQRQILLEEVERMSEREGAIAGGPRSDDNDDPDDGGEFSTAEVLVDAN